uniref:Transmembrane protein n=1 Tax=Cacopsylla melanoneura TaxID=428564 RepID=A0A8D8ZXN4_9HEMI
MFSALDFSRTLSAISLSEYSFIFCSRCLRLARDRLEASLFRLRSSRYLPDSYSSTSSSSVRRRFLVVENVLLDVEEQEMFRFLAGRVSSFFFTVDVTRLGVSHSLSSCLTVTGDNVSYTKSSNIFFCLIRLGRMVAICFGLFTSPFPLLNVFCVFAVLPMLLFALSGFFVSGGVLVGAGVGVGLFNRRASVVS